MPSYVALLRAVNVGKRQVTMMALRECLTASGLEEVETYIQTGNVRFRSTMRSAAKVEQHVERTLAAGCGFDVPAIIFTPSELRQVYDDAVAATPARGNPGGENRYVVFFKEGDQPSGAGADAIAAWDREGEAGLVIGRAVHVWLDGPMHRAKFFGAFAKPLFPGTNRNLTVVTALARRWGS